MPEPTTCLYCGKPFVSPDRRRRRRCPRCRYLLEECRRYTFLLTAGEEGVLHIPAHLRKRRKAWWPMYPPPLEEVASTIRHWKRNGDGVLEDVSEQSRQEWLQRKRLASFP